MGKRYLFIKPRGEDRVKYRSLATAAVYLRRNPSGPWKRGKPATGFTERTLAWHIFIREADGSEDVSTALTRERAVAWAKAHIEIGIRVLQIESDDGHVIDEAEIKAQAAKRWPG